MNANITLKVSGTAKSVPIAVVELHEFPKAFRFRDGNWLLELKNQPVSVDNVVDFAVLSAGVPGMSYSVTITVAVGTKKAEKVSEDTFSRKGWGVIKDKINLPS